MRDDAGAFALLFAFQWLGLQGLLLMLYRGRYQIGHVAPGEPQDQLWTTQEWQYRLWHLLVFMTIVAAVLSLARFLLAEFRLDVLLTLILIGTAHTVVPMMANWAALSPGLPAVRVPVSLAATVIWTAFHSLLYGGLHATNRFDFAWWLVHLLAHFVLVAGTLLALRWVGFQLRRRSADSAGRAAVAGVL